MCRIHPDESKCGFGIPVNNNEDRQYHSRVVASPSIAKFTVWKRSSMSFQGTDGFTVFDRRGRLVFRLDNYQRKNRCGHGGGGLVLMDGVGNALLTLRPQVLSMQCQWHAYKGDDGLGNRIPNLRVFTMRRPSPLLFHSGDIEAEVFLGGYAKHGQVSDFSIEGSFARRNCMIKSSVGEVVAKISRKKANKAVLLSTDVFNLAVQPGFDTNLAMAFIVILDRISRKPYMPALCS